MKTQREEILDCIFLTRELLDLYQLYVQVLSVCTHQTQLLLIVLYKWNKTFYYYHLNLAKASGLNIRYDSNTVNG